MLLVSSTQKLGPGGPGGGGPGGRADSQRAGLDAGLEGSPVLLVSIPSLAEGCGSGGAAGCLPCHRRSANRAARVR